jgi:hypothetical protein
MAAKAIKYYKFSYHSIYYTPAMPNTIYIMKQAINSHVFSENFENENGTFKHNITRNLKTSLYDY